MSKYYNPTAKPVTLLWLLFTLWSYLSVNTIILLTSCYFPWKYHDVDLTAMPTITGCCNWSGQKTNSIQGGWQQAALPTTIRIYSFCLVEQQVEKKVQVRFLKSFQWLAFPRLVWSRDTVNCRHTLMASQTHSLARSRPGILDGILFALKVLLVVWHLRKIENIYILLVRD